MKLISLLEINKKKSNELWTCFLSVYFPDSMMYYYQLGFPGETNADLKTFITILLIFILHITDNPNVYVTFLQYRENKVTISLSINAKLKIKKISRMITR